MQLLTLEQVLVLHQQVIEQSGGATGIRDRGILESALAQPLMSYDGQDFVPNTNRKSGRFRFLIN